MAFQNYYESIATPFEWRFTKDDLAALLRKLDRDQPALPVAPLSRSFLGVPFGASP